MALKCGIVGLPNVGKSTLFNALTQSSSAQTANYPFCTIEPKTGEIAVPDSRLQKIAEITGSRHIMPGYVSFVDIAGLVRGASKGNGLGNQFLANIRETNAIIHVLRCFEDTDITHVEGRIDPVSDAETVETELMLSDLDMVQKRIVQIRKRSISKDPESVLILPIMEEALSLLEQGKSAREMLSKKTKEEKNIIASLNLLTIHPVLYVCNVEESEALKGNKHTKAVEEMAQKNNAGVMLISASIESELSKFSPEERNEYLATAGMEEPSLDRLIREGFALLDLINYFTTGPKETRSWTIRRGTKAPEAAGVIHTDFTRGFIRAQTISYEDFINAGGESGAKDAGKVRDEGKEYIVQDGDIVLFKFNT